MRPEGVEATIASAVCNDVKISELGEKSGAAVLAALHRYGKVVVDRSEMEALDAEVQRLRAALGEWPEGTEEDRSVVAEYLEPEALAMWADTLERRSPDLFEIVGFFRTLARIAPLLREMLTVEEEDPILRMMASEYARAEGARLASEIEALRRWKAEAIEVIARWDRVWEALGRPGPLGGFRSDNSLAEVERLRSEWVTDPTKLKPNTLTTVPQDPPPPPGGRSVIELRGQDDPTQNGFYKWQGDHYERVDAAYGFTFRKGPDGEWHLVEEEEGKAT